jgi:hypothetical protein
MSELGDALELLHGGWTGDDDADGDARAEG